ncbi:MAG: hypothetical protein ACREOS_05860, partial [Candidatus Dormibacteraceae bacterium]
QQVKSDSSDGDQHVSKAKVEALEASSGVDGLAQQGKQLDKVDSIDQGVKQVQATTEQVASSNQSDQGERLTDEAQVKQHVKDLKKVDQQPDEGPAITIEPSQPQSTGKEQSGSKKTTVQTKPVAGTVQREPSKLQKFKNWLKRTFSSIKKRVARAIAKLRAKVTQIALHVIGIKKFQADLDDALVEQRAEATAVTTAIDESKQASTQYVSSADQFAQKVAKARETAGKK